MLPLANKRLARVLRGPSDAWRDVIVDLIPAESDDDDDAEEDHEQTGQEAVKQLDTAALLAWFTSRPG